MENFAWLGGSTARNLLLGLALGSLVATTGCETNKSEEGAASQPPIEVLAEVNGQKITREMVEFYVGRGRPVKPGPEETADAVDKLIEQALLYQDGLDKALDKDPGYQQLLRRKEMEMEELKQREVVRRLYQQHVYPRLTATEEEARAFYEANKEHFGAELHLYYLRFRDMEHALATQKLLQGGQSFEQVASQRTNRLKPQGRPPWDMGFLNWQRIPGEWSDALFALKPGEVSQIIEGRTTGIRIFKLVERKKVPTPPFEALHGVIRNRIRDGKVEGFVKEYTDTLRAKASIKRM